MNKGDRVICIRSYQNGVFPGEQGIVLEIKYDTALVRWDTYNSVRHNCEGRCDIGHGWNVPLSRLQRISPVKDLGDLPVLDINTIL